MAATSPLLQALSAHQVLASVEDLDNYRIHGGLAVETDYIISVRPTEGNDSSFDSFKLSKTYSEVRTLAKELKKVAEKAASEAGCSQSDVANAVKLAESVYVLVNSQSKAYLDKVSFAYVKTLAKQRSQIIDDVLDVILKRYPSDAEKKDSLQDITSVIESFFLTDHCEEDEEEEGSVSASSSGLTPSIKSKRNLGFEVAHGLQSIFTPGKDSNRKKIEVAEKLPLPSPVVPKSRKSRRSVVLRAVEEEQLRDAAHLILDEDEEPAEPKQSRSRAAPKAAVKSKGESLSDSPYVLYAIAVGALAVLRSVQDQTVTINTDVAMLIAFACFCLGLYTPGPSATTISTPAAPPLKKTKIAGGGAVEKTDLTNRRLLRKSMMASPTAANESMRAAWQVANEEEEEEGDEDEAFGSPLPVFPEGAELGTYFNCWSEPTFSDFKVRGPNYLTDKHKVESGPFLFPIRGIDLFLTDACPENVGSITGVMGGSLRDVPSFIFNFRLPWGVLLFYAEIPNKLVPYLNAGYDPAFDKSTLPSLESMTPAERTACRFLMADDEQKNKTLKLVPVVVNGPWVVKSVVGGKPAIIGTKLPITYVYSPREGKKAEYLEADLDIAASSAARSILSVCTSYAKGLTIDLGFVIQANEEDELPEQMLTASRIHGIDPVNAPCLPPMKHLFLNMDDE